MRAAAAPPQAAGRWEPCVWPKPTRSRIWEGMQAAAVRRGRARWCCGAALRARTAPAAGTRPPGAALRALRHAPSTRGRYREPKSPVLEQPQRCPGAQPGCAGAGGDVEGLRDPGPAAAAAGVRSPSDPGGFQSPRPFRNARWKIQAWFI